MSNKEQPTLISGWLKKQLDPKTRAKDKIKKQIAQLDWEIEVAKLEQEVEEKRKELQTVRKAPSRKAP